MTSEVEMITISLAEYEKMQERLEWLDALEQAGVDNWIGMDDAADILRENQNGRS